MQGSIVHEMMPRKVYNSIHCALTASPSSPVPPRSCLSLHRPVPRPSYVLALGTTQGLSTIVFAIRYTVTSIWVNQPLSFHVCIFPVRGAGGSRGRDRGRDRRRGMQSVMHPCFLYLSVYVWTCINAATVLSLFCKPPLCEGQLFV